jgi:hypothetical protein
MRKTASHVVNVNPLSGSVQLFTAEFVIMTPRVAVRSRTVRYVECQKERQWYVDRQKERSLYFFRICV